MEDQTRSPLTVGLILESATVPQYLYELVEWSRNRDDLLLTRLIVFDGMRDAPASARARRRRSLPHRVAALAGKVALDAICKAERSFLARHPGYPPYLKLHDASDLIRGAPALCCGAGDVERLKSLNLDLLVTWGPPHPAAALSAAARLGVLCVTAGDGTLYGGEPCGFWEVYDRSDTSGILIRRLREGDEGAEVLFRGAFPTKTFYLMNQASLQQKSNHYLKELLRKIAETRCVDPIDDAQPSYCRPCDTPSAGAALAYAWKQSVLLSTRVANALLKRDYRWGVAFAFERWQSLAMGQATRIDNPPNHFLADPFVVERDDRTICFVEDYDFALQRGCIVAYELSDSCYERLGEAIVEPFHMSFPFLFEHDGDLYMCPETSAAMDIRVYKCVGFPLQWKLTARLMSGIRAVDTMIFQKDGVWWLFTNIDQLGDGDADSELHIFYSSDPLGSRWTPHARNPVIVDASKARNGGILSDHGAVYRVAQAQGYDIYGYGKAFSINRMRSLSPSEYIEERVAAVEPKFFPHLVGTHHMHSTGKVTAFDYAAFSKVKD